MFSIMVSLHYDKYFHIKNMTVISDDLPQALLRIIHDSH
jgi:hypothetical protein